MRLFVWVPGILGSGLRRKRSPHEEIWPPGANGTFKSRTFKQLTADLEPTQIIAKVCGVPIYSTIGELFVAAGVKRLTTRPTADSLLEHPYDWRLGIEIEADRLAATLDQVTVSGDEIVLVGHSMGALLIRFLLEADRYATHPFISRVSRFVSINGPLLGAPIMLARALALEQTDFIKWSEQKKILAQPGFAGGYVLLPAPSRSQFFNGSIPLDLYSPDIQAHFGLGAANMVEAARMWERIAAGSRRSSIRYVLLSSLLDDKRTIERVSFIDGQWTRVRDAGDGAVPPWSSRAITSAVRPEPIPGEHRGMIDTPQFRSLFSEHVAQLPAPEAAPSITLQPLKQHVRAGGVAEFAVVREGAGGGEGVLAWTPVGDGGAPTGPVELKTGVALPQAAAPVISSRAPDRAGLYSVSLMLGDARARARIGVRGPEEAPASAPAAPA